MLCTLLVAQPLSAVRFLQRRKTPHRQECLCYKNTERARLSTQREVLSGVEFFPV